MIGIVLDTNVYISGILFGGNSRDILNKIIEGKITLYISIEIFDEIKDVLLRKKFDFPSEIIHHIINEIESISELIFPTVFYNIVKKDKDDNIIINCAVEAKVDFIVTGDKILQDIKSFKGIEILSPHDFLDRIK